MKRYDVNGTLRSLSDADAKRLGFDPEKDGVERKKWESNKARTPAQTHKKEKQPEGGEPSDTETPEPVPTPEPEDEPAPTDTDVSNKARRTRQS